MRLTFGNRKQLKRVSGEVQLAAIKDDPQRPPTGVPLKRCNNKARINLLQDSTSTLKSATTESSNTSPDIVYSNATVSTEIEYGGVGEREIYHFPNTATQYRFGTSTSEKIVVPNNSAAVTPRTNSFNFAASVNTQSHKASLQYKTHKKHAVPKTRDTFTLDNCSSVGPTLSKFQSLTETVESNTPQNVKERAANPAPEVLIATATSLGLQDSNRALSSRPSNWSLKNQAATPKSPFPSSSTLRNDNEGTEKKLVTSSTTLPMSSNTGDGDSASVPTNSGSKKGVQSLPPKAPPPSAATTRSPFKFTFRKPKLRPRSIITSVSGSERASLPTTASTPNPMMPRTPPEEARERSNNNQNNDIDNNNNTNIVQEGDAQLQLVRVKSDKNNNETVKPKFSKEKVPSAIFAVEKDVVKGKEFQVMPAEVVPAQPIPAAEEPQGPDGFYQVDEVDQSFWNSDSTPPSEKPEPEQEILTRASNASKTSKEYGGPLSSDIYDSNSGYDSNSKKYPVSGYGSQLNPSGYGANGTPFLTTEKGAIRFHLPGRIQHKTTIKVAHFPTGDEKNVVVNLKPDKEEDVYCDPPNCANNQNFVVQQPSYPPPAPYGSYPYGYGYGAPNYYGYGGYPPYY